MTSVFAYNAAFDRDHLPGDDTYHEKHNALCDGLDELEIMRLLDHRLTAYIPLQC